MQGQGADRPATGTAKAQLGIAGMALPDFEYRTPGRLVIAAGCLKMDFTSGAYSRQLPLF